MATKVLAFEYTQLERYRHFEYDILKLIIVNENLCI